MRRAFRIFILLLGDLMRYSIRNFFLVFLISIVIFSAIGVFVIQYADSVISQLSKPSQNANGPSGMIQNPEEKDPTQNTEEKSSTVSFLVCGIDEMNGWADSVFLIQINKTDSKYAVINIPANTRLFVGGQDRAIGSLTALDSPEFLKAKVNAITGLKVDHYVCVEMDDFAKLVDTAGGINFNVPVDMKYRDDEQSLKINLTAGIQRLNGEKALEMLRFRGYENGLEGRDNTHVEFFKTFAAAVLKSANVFKAQSLVTDIFGCIKTDMTSTDFLANASLIFSFDTFKVSYHTYPGRYVTEGGSDWYVPSIDGAFTMFEIYR